MIKWTRIVIVAVFVLVAAAFLYTKVTDRLDSDNQPPVITADSEELTVSVAASDEDLMAGMTAVDNRDGDVTDSMVVASKSKFIRPGVCNITYAAFDQHNNVASYTRRVIYEDYHSPEFQLDVPLIYSMNARNVDYLANVRATDLLDGDLTSLIRMSSGIQQSMEDGSISMPLTLQVVNSSGDAEEIEIDVVYLDESSYRKEAPALTQYIVYTTVGKEVDAAAYLYGVRSGIDQTIFDLTDYSLEDVSIDSSGVDYSTPGIYRLRYTLHPQGLLTGAAAADGGEQEGTNAEELMALGYTDLYVVVKEVS